MKIHTETLGQGPDLVLIHGWGYSSVILKDFAFELSKYFRVTLIDLPGYGKSSFNDESLDTSLQELAAILPPTAILVGWSLGGLISLKLAFLFPSRFTKVIAISTNPCFVEKEAWPGVTSDLFSSFERKLDLNHKRLLSEFTLLQIHNTKNEKHLYQTIKNKLQKDNLPNKQSLKNGLQFLNHTDLRTELANLKNNTLFILSDNDSLVPKRIATELENINPKIKIKNIENGTHIPFLVKPDDVIKSIYEFCN